MAEVVKRGRGQPPHAPTKASRKTVQTMVAAGMLHDDIARAHGISRPTLAKHYRNELDNGKTMVDTMVVTQHLKNIRRGDSSMIKWWEQARMGWKGDRDETTSAESMRIAIELVGEKELRSQTIDHTAPDPDDVFRKRVDLVG